jgi:hypothetical protein
MPFTHPRRSPRAARIRPRTLRIRPRTPQSSAVGIFRCVHAAMIVVSISSVFVSSSAWAVQKNWINPAGGTVTTAGNWSPNGMPAAGDDHNYNLSGTFTVTYASPVTASNSIIFHRGNITFVMNATHTANALFRIADTDEICTLTLTTGTLQSGAPAAVLGNGVGGTGTLNVNDSDATFQTTTTTSDIHVGHVGGGVLNVTNGGQVIGSDDIIIGNMATAVGTATVNGFNASPPPGMTSHMRTTAINGDIIVGLSGRGTLNIQAGGKVTSSDDVWIASSAVSQGTVKVGGTGLTNSTLVVTDMLDLARNDNANPAGLGLLEIMADGVVTVGGVMRIGDPHGSNATLKITDGTLNVTSSISGDGTIMLTNGSITAASLTLNSGTISGTGTINGPVDVSGLPPASCSVKPGHSAGLLTVNGSYDQDGATAGSGGTLEMELGGALPAEYDRLEISGAAALGGTLRVLVIDGFLPDDGAQFTILTATSISGTFDVLEFPKNGQTWSIAYNPTSVVLTAMGVLCPADVAPSGRGNGVVDIDDLLLVINSWGNAGGPADINGSGMVDIDDLLAVINAWGMC